MRTHISFERVSKRGDKSWHQLQIIYHAWKKSTGHKMKQLTDFYAKSNPGELVTCRTFIDTDATGPVVTGYYWAYTKDLKNHDGYFTP